MKERYHVTGMTCSACSSHVEKSVNKLAGVNKASVNLLTETMDVEYDHDKLSAEDIVAAVEKAGYGAEPMKGSNAGGSRMAGSSMGTGDKGKADDSIAVGEKGAADSSAASGNSGTMSNARQKRDSLKRKQKEESRAMKLRLGVSIGFLLPLMYVAMFHMYNQWFGLPIPEWVNNAFHGNANAMNFALTQFLLVLPILYMNRKYFIVGFRTLAHRSPNMDSLIALGASAAVGYGIFAMYRISYGLGHGDMVLVEQYSHDLYFESAGMILTLITVGKYLESRSKGKTGDAITKLMDLSPKTAIVLDEQGKEQEIPTENVQKGMTFLVKPGSLVPVDGTVLEGNSSVDEAAITGESVPVEKQTGDTVVSATMNKSGFLKCRADRVGEDTTLAQIIRLVEEAGGSKAPIARLADKVAGIFVPVVISIALLTLCVWLLAGQNAEFSISTAIAVLVISCPCALGLATPVAIMVGTGVGANHGILMKSGEALQRAKEIDTVVLDKTGTVTEGNLKVMDVVCTAEGMTGELLLGMAAALEKRSEHPLAEAVTAAAEIHGVKGWQEWQVDNFRAVFGRGVQGELKLAVNEAEDIGYWQKSGDKESKACLYIGNVAFLKEQHIAIAPEIQDRIDALADKGQTPLLVADESRLLGIIGVADRIRESSREAIEAWKRLGIHVIMLTGDNKRTAEAVRRTLELEEVIAEVLPQDKEKNITRLKEQGRKVAMIGDGINDAPALAAADVGMAIGAGTDVAMESADIILMKSDLRDAVTAMGLSRAVIRNIRQNLFWAFFYNSIGIPLAAGLLYPIFGLRLNPMFGAAAMSMSSIFVVGNALRLRAFRSGFSDKAYQKEKKEAAADSINMETINVTETKTGKEENKMTKVMTIEGMACGHCTGRVQKALEALEGVSGVEMSLEQKTATVTLSAEVSDETLTATVTEAGYEVISIA